jgi:hypothetical protein
MIIYGIVIYRKIGLETAAANEVKSSQVVCVNAENVKEIRRQKKNQHSCINVQVSFIGTWNQLEKRHQ